MKSNILINVSIGIILGLNLFCLFENGKNQTVYAGEEIGTNQTVTGSGEKHNTDPVFNPEERKIEIIINLSIGLKYTPNNFRNITAYKKIYNFSGRSLDEKKILIEYWNLINIQGTVKQKNQVRSIVENLGIGLRDSPEAFETRENFNHMYGYKEKNHQYQSILDKFWRILQK